MADLQPGNLTTGRANMRALILSTLSLLVLAMGFPVRVFGRGSNGPIFRVEYE
jgi:hypothetical protein